jgi:hypothetical protein
MADVSNELIYEELSAIRGHMKAVQCDVHVIYDRLDSLERRVERIERRLELTSGKV